MRVHDREQQRHRQAHVTAVTDPLVPVHPAFHLQRLVGNRAACELLKGERLQGDSGADQPDVAEPPLPAEPGAEPDELDLLDDQPGQATVEGAAERFAPSDTGRVAAVFTGDGPASSAASPAAGRTMSSKDEVSPTGNPRTNLNAAGSTCTPDDIRPADVDWQAVDDGKKWRAEVTALRTAGQINVNPTPSVPNAEVTPNTANPVVGGNLNNTKDSQNYWKFAIKEMKEYHTSKGGRSNYWHSSVASKAHEDAHWNTDWLKNVLGSTWPAARKSIGRITVSKEEAADAGAAKAAMKPKVEAKIDKLETKSTRKWNAVPDEPGAWFANGYKAGQRVLDGLVDRVEAFAKSQKW